MKYNTIFRQKSAAYAVSKPLCFKYLALFVAIALICTAIPLTVTALGDTLTDGNVTVTGSFPEGASLMATKLEEEQIKEYASDGSEVLFAYDIKIMVNGEEWQPEKAVTVEIEHPEKIDSEVTVLHINTHNQAGDATLESIESTTDKNTVEFEAESFSIYIGTVNTLMVYPYEMYWNGSGFYYDENCETPLIDRRGDAFTTMPELIASLDGNAVIYMKAPYTVSGTQTFDGGHYKVTLIRHSADTENSLITVPDGCVLTLSNITLDGGAVWTGASDATLGRGKTNSGIVANQSLAVVAAGGTLTIKDGAVLKNNDFKNTNNTGRGGGVSNSGTLNITGGIIKDQNGSYGGGIFNDGVMNMSGGTLSGNTAFSYGGGVQSHNVLNLSGGTITGNKAQSGGSGVLCYMTVNMTGGTITGNTTSSLGGGVRITRGGTLTMSGGTISGNTANYGGGIHTQAGELIVTGGEISGNTANSGGGIYSRDDTPVLSGGTISGNTAAVNGNGIFSTSETGDSGGIILSGSPAIADGIKLSANRYITIDTSGGDFTPATEVIVTSEITAQGTAIVHYRDETAVTTAHIANFFMSGYNLVAGTAENLQENYILIGTQRTAQFVSASGDDENDGLTPATAVLTLEQAQTNLADGGAIVVCSELAVTQATTITKSVLLTSVWNGVDYRQTAGAQIIRSSAEPAYTGEVLNYSSLVVTLTLMCITLDGGAVWGGTVDSVIGRGTVNSGITAEASIINGTRGVLNINAGTLIRNNSQPDTDPNKYRGAIYCDTVVMNSGSVTDCSGYGPVFTISTKLTMNGGKICRNSGKYGSVTVHGQFIMNGGEISQNKSRYDGGAVYISNLGSMIMNGGYIINNYAGQNGGGISSPKVLSITGGTISGNTAVSGGGGIHCSFSVIMTGGSITGNSSASSGGGVACRGGSITGGSITGNSSTSNGGGLACYNGDLNITGGFITGNSSASSGGGIIISGNTAVNIGTGATITGNTAPRASCAHNSGTIRLSGSPELSGIIELSVGKLLMVSTVDTPFTPSQPIELMSIATTPGTNLVCYEDYTDGVPANAFTQFISDSFTLCAGTAANSEANYLEIAYSNIQFVSAAGDDINDGLTAETAVQTLAKAYDNVNSNGTIVICSSINLNCAQTVDKAITLTYKYGTASYPSSQLERYRFSAANYYTGAFFNVVAGGKLTLNNITLDGGAVWMGTYNNVLGRNSTNTGAQATGALVCLSGGELHIAEGAALKNNFVSAGNYYGGAVSATGSGTVTMSGGTVTRCASHDGGGIAISGSGSILNLSGGTVSSNQGENGGGGIYANNGASIIMSGGSVTYNSANSGGGVGVYNTNCTFDMTGGEIRHNNSSGTSYGGGLYAIAAAQFSGSPVIADNTNGTVSNDIEVSSAIPKIVAPLDDGARLGVCIYERLYTLSLRTVFEPGAGYTITDSDMEKVFSDNSKYYVCRGRELDTIGLALKATQARLDYSDAIAGSVLTASLINGTAVSYRWQISTDGETWQDIPDATSSTYTVTSSDLGKLIRVVITDDSTPTGTYLSNDVISWPNTPTYYVTIPEEITVNEAAGEMRITAVVSDFEPNQSINVSVDSLNSFNLVGAHDELPYTLYIDSQRQSQVTAQDNAVTTFKYNGVSTMPVYYSISSTPVYAGIYTDTLTFTVEFIS